MYISKKIVIVVELCLAFQYTRVEINVNEATATWWSFYIANIYWSPFAISKLIYDHHGELWQLSVNSKLPHPCVQPKTINICKITNRDHSLVVPSYLKIPQNARATTNVVGIDHVFASGTVVWRATTHEWGRPSLRAQRGAGRPHECLVARPTTAPDAKTWSISILPRSFRL